MSKLKMIFTKLVVGSIIVLQAGVFPTVVLAEEATGENTSTETTTEAIEESVTTEETVTETTSTESTETTETTETTQTTEQTSTTEEETTTTSTTQSTSEEGAAEDQSAPSTPGPQSPNGVESNSYVYNPETGLWENDYYSWNPVTKQTKPKVPTNYSYNPETGLWDTTEYVFNAVTRKYEPNIVSVPSSEMPEVVQAQLLSDLSPEQLDEYRELATDSLRKGVANNNINNEIQLDGTFDLFFDAYISNRMLSVARSGDAAVLNNTTGGSAMTGDALAMTTAVNMVQSAWNPDLGELMTFVANIDGDVVGDLIVDPGSATSGQLDVTETATLDADLDLTINNNATIDNEIVLDAQSGNATVAGNTEAGSATTGNADAIANVVNMLNSTIAAGQSFMGVININGDYEGDILFPPEMLERLLLDNSAPYATINASQVQDYELMADITDNYAINNDINTTAASGNTAVDSNTTGGSATSGDAETNITVLNLTGKEVIGTNALLVFVNVLGEWVGLIMDAPSGTTSAAIGGGINSEKNIDISADLDTEITNNFELNNNLDISAASGHANVSNNTSAGDASSGDATASANVANMLGTNLNLSDWFGILYINVFGSWRGSFGVDTAMGDMPMMTSPTSKPTSQPRQEPRVFTFVPNESGVVTTTGSSTTSGGSSGNTAPTSTGTPETLGSSTASHRPVAEMDNGADIAWLPFFGLVAGAGLLGYDRIYLTGRKD